MNLILNEIKDIICNAVAKYLPEVSLCDLEGNGEIYYMNGENGTEFDWFVNEHLPYFMMFYNDEENMGAVKAMVYDDGGMCLYLYGENGNKPLEEVKTFLDVKEDELLRLAVCLRENADDKQIWDSALGEIESDTPSSEDVVSEFLDNRKYYEESIRRRELMGKLCIVSKMITEEGWKVGVMQRNEPHDENDSGWLFLSGNEDQEYVDDTHNLELCVVGSIAGIDPAVVKYIDSPIGTSLVKKSADEFEEDEGQDIYVEKWR